MSLVPLSHLLVLVYFHNYFIVLSSLHYCFFFLSFSFTALDVAMKGCGKMFCHPMLIWNGVSTQTPSCNSKVTPTVFPVSVYMLILTVRVCQPCKNVITSKSPKCFF